MVDPFKFLNVKYSARNADTYVVKLLNDLVWGSTSELIELERKRDQQSAIIISKITELFDTQQLKKSQAKLKNWEMDIQKLIDKK